MNAEKLLKVVQFTLIFALLGALTFGVICVVNYAMDNCWPWQQYPTSETQQ